MYGPKYAHIQKRGSHSFQMYGPKYVIVYNAFLYVLFETKASLAVRRSQRTNKTYHICHTTIRGHWAVSSRGEKPITLWSAASTGSTLCPHTQRTARDVQKLCFFRNRTHGPLTSSRGPSLPGEREAALLRAGCLPLELLLRAPPPPRDSAPWPFSFPPVDAAVWRRVTAGVASARRPRCAPVEAALMRARAAGLLRLADSMMIKIMKA